VVDRLRYLAAIFAIDVCAYAVMATHDHTMFFGNEDVARLDIPVNDSLGVCSVQTVCNLTDFEEGFLRAKRYISIDRDGKCAESFRLLVKESGIAPLFISKS
jgi:hypothetical protein